MRCNFYENERKLQQYNYDYTNTWRCNFYENERKLQLSTDERTFPSDVTFMNMKGNYNQEPLFPSFEYERKLQQNKTQHRTLQRCNFYEYERKLQQPSKKNGTIIER